MSTPSVGLLLSSAVLCVSVQLSMCGQTPHTIMEAALTGIKFYCEQQRLSAQYEQNVFNKKFTKMQAQCKQKLEQVHQGYLQVCWPQLLVVQHMQPQHVRYTVHGPCIRLSPCRTALRGWLSRRDASILQSVPSARFQPYTYRTMVPVFVVTPSHWQTQCWQAVENISLVLQAKRKYQETVQERNAMQQDVEELQQKYTQKAT